MTETSFEEIVAQKTGREHRIARVVPLTHECAYRVEFKDDEERAPIVVAWHELHGAGVPVSDLDIYL